MNARALSSSVTLYNTKILYKKLTSIIIKLYEIRGITIKIIIIIRLTVHVRK